MRIGLIGCGWIAETHLETLGALGEEVVCVCDPDPQRLAWATGATGAEGFADWEPAHAVAELRREGHYRVEVVGLTPPGISVSDLIALRKEASTRDPEALWARLPEVRGSSFGSALSVMGVFGLRY